MKTSRQVNKADDSRMEKRPKCQRSQRKMLCSDKRPETQSTGQAITKTHIRENLTSDIVINKQTARLPTSSAQKNQ